MDSRTKQALINELSKVSGAKHPITFKQKGKTVTVILSIEDHQEFCAERGEKLDQLKI